jgi:hypothetical protein
MSEEAKTGPYIVFARGFLEAKQNGTLDEWHAAADAKGEAANAEAARIASIADDVRGHLEADARVREEERLKKLQR